MVCFDEAVSTKEMLEGSKLPEEDREEYVRGITDAMEVARTYKTEGEGRSESDGDKYPLVTFLGTGSSVPSKYRNVTGILVETQPGSFIIMDCGEGTLGQLVRLHGQEVRGLFMSRIYYSDRIISLNVSGSREGADWTEVCLHQSHAR